MENNQKPTIQLSLEVLIRECRKEGKDKKELFHAFGKTNYKNIHEVFRYQKFQDNFTDYITCYNDGEHVIGSFRPSFKEFMNKVLLFLNVPIKKVSANEEIIQMAKERIRILESITTEDKLLEEFPFIYNDLVEGRKYIEKVESIKDIYPGKYKEWRHYYYSCALKRSLKKFLEAQVVLYTRFIDQKDEYKEKIESMSYDQFIRDNFDLSKIAQYAVYEYLKKCENTKNREELEEYFHFVENYWNSAVDKEVSIKIKDGEIIKKEYLEEKTKEIKEKIRNQSSLVGWVLIPEGRDYEKVKVKQDTMIRRTKLSEEERKHLLIKGKEKQNFYDQSSYIAKAMGLEKYDGYMAYIYENGEILLDRKFNEEKPYTAKGDAIYHIRVENFEELSKLDKRTLKDNDKVERLIHSKNWKDKATRIIKREATEFDKEKTKTLIKKIEKNKRTT